MNRDELEATIGAILKDAVRGTDSLAEMTEEGRLVYCTARMLSLLEPVLRDHEVLEKIANDGCNFAEIKRTPDGHSQSVWCPDRHPGNASEWCWSCVAAEALKRKEEAES